MEISKNDLGGNRTCAEKGCGGLKCPLLNLTAIWPSGLLDPFGRQENELKNELDHSFGSQYFAPQRHEGSGGRMRRALRAAPSCFGSRYFGAQPRRRRGPGARGGCSFLSLLILFSLSSPLFFPLFSLFSPLFSPSFPPFFKKNGRTR